MILGDGAVDVDAFRTAAYVAGIFKILSLKILF